MTTERKACEAYISSRYPLAGTSDADDSFEAAMLKCWQAACAWQREQDAKVCDGIELREWHAYKGRNVSAETRYKVGSDYWQGFSDGAGNCAGAIRAQGER